MNQSVNELLLLVITLSGRVMLDGCAKEGTFWLQGLLFIQN